MKKTMTAKEASAIKDVLAVTKLGAMASADKIKATKAYNSLKKASAEYDAALTNAREKLKPEGFDELMGKAGSGTATRQEMAELNRLIGAYNREVEAAVASEATKEVEVEVEALTDEAISNLYDSNPDMAVADLSQLGDFLSAQEG